MRGGCVCAWGCRKVAYSTSCYLLLLTLFCSSQVLQMYLWTKVLEVIQTGLNCGAVHVHGGKPQKLHSKLIHSHITHQAFYSHNGEEPRTVCHMINITYMY